MRRGKLGSARGGGNFWEKLGRFTHPSFTLGARPHGGGRWGLSVVCWDFVSLPYWGDVIENRQAIASSSSQRFTTLAGQAFRRSLR